MKGLVGSVGPFAGAIGTRITGSATVGGFAGMGAQQGIGALAAVGPAGMAAAAAIGGLVIGATALKEVFDRLRSATEGAARSIESYSPDVAGAYAMQQVADIRMRLRRGQEIGPQLAGFVRAQTELRTTMEDLKTDLLGELTPLLTELYQGITELVNVLGPAVVALTREGAEPFKQLMQIGPRVFAAIEALKRGDWHIGKRVGEIADNTRRLAEEEEDRKHREAIHEAISFFNPEFHWERIEGRLGVGREHVPARGPGIF
jgi:hypothetical protein